MIAKNRLAEQEGIRPSWRSLERINRIEKQVRKKGNIFLTYVKHMLTLAQIYR
jgi:hypothetical protein